MWFLSLDLTHTDSTSLLDAEFPKGSSPKEELQGWDQAEAGKECRFMALQGEHLRMGAS